MGMHVNVRRSVCVTVNVDMRAIPQHSSNDVDSQQDQRGKEATSSAIPKFQLTHACINPKHGPQGV